MSAVPATVAEHVKLHRYTTIGTGDADRGDEQSRASDAND